MNVTWSQMSLDQIFSTAVLNVLVPDTSLEFPPNIPVDKWIASAQLSEVERRQAFYDEQLQSFLVLRIKHPTLENLNSATHPPQVLLETLAHIQVSLEASYISSVPTVPEGQRTSRLLATPRTGSMAKPTGRNNPHPSILPPSTPNPVPSTADQDRKYTTSEGTMLAAHIWGSRTDSSEGFTLLWSEEQQAWLAIYCTAITVAFLRLTFRDPLLCLTVSATLREKPIPTTPKHPLARFFASVGGSKDILSEESPQEPADESPVEREISLLDGLEEANLLNGLLAGPEFAKLGPSQFNLSTLRLGTVSRRKLFSLPPALLATPKVPTPSPMTAVRKAHPTLRKSFRKTFLVASGFRVRMRTVFVPYVLLPETEGTIADLEEEEKDRERREAGSEERTVVLCVEIENSGDLEMNAGFLVEKVDVSIGGEGAKATLIGWGDYAFCPNASKNMFPLRIGPLAQYNLLYAVTIMRSPEEMDAFSFARSTNPSAAMPDLQRAVTINVFGKPYFPPPSTETKVLEKTADISYLTQTFSSRWNCVLDLAAQQGPSAELLDAADPSGAYPSILPQAASPFPSYSTYSSNAYYHGDQTPQFSATAGSKQFTLQPGVNFAGRTLKNITPTRSFPKPGGGQSPLTSGQFPSHTLIAKSSSDVQYLRSPTTYSAPPPPPVPFINQLTGQLSEPDQGYTSSPLESLTGVEMPTTPAYPAFPPKSALPPTPMSQGPIAASGNVGMSIEIRRERGLGLDANNNVPPHTPLPLVSGAFGEQRMLSKLQTASASGESIVVSVGLLSIHDSTIGDKEIMLGPGKIYPLDVFTLDIFVFNRSLWPRRFEVTCPERRRRRRGGTEMGVYDGGGEAARKMGYPGVLPMESRVRIGPLRPSACQSVRMNFLAVLPGVHSIDTLTLTDTESGFSMNLRSVIDIVVHDPNN